MSVRESLSTTPYPESGLLGLGYSFYVIANDAGAHAPFFWIMLVANGINLVAGYGTAMLLAHRAAKKRFGFGWRSLMFLPIYWLIMTPAAWRALFQLLFDPHRWEKTSHGLSKGRPSL